MVGEGVGRGQAACRPCSRAARRDGLSVAAHIEPYSGAVGRERRRRHRVSADARDQARSTSSSRSTSRAAEWAPANDSLERRAGLRPDRARRRGGGGPLRRRSTRTTCSRTAPASLRAPLHAGARRTTSLCLPSVGPGYDARRATGDTDVKPRRNGPTYDSMWHAAIAAHADGVTVTSFNEWHEGTQIEPAAPSAVTAPYARSYNGAWGLHGAAARSGVPRRALRYWAAAFRKPARRTRHVAPYPSAVAGPHRLGAARAAAERAHGRAARRDPRRTRR